MHVGAYSEDLDLWGEVEEDYEIPYTSEQSHIDFNLME